MQQKKSLMMDFTDDNSSAPGHDEYRYAKFSQAKLRVTDQTAPDEFYWRFAKFVK